MLLIIFQIVFVIYMAYHDLHGQNVCVLGKSCELVQDTKYGQIAGIKLPFVAIFAFGVLLICYIFAEKLFLIGNFIGLVVSLSLIYIQTFILRMFCVNCLVVDTTMIIIFVLSIFEVYLNKKN